VKITALVLPPAAATVTFLAPSPADVEIAKLAVIVVSLTTVKSLTVNPEPLTATLVAPSSPFPVRVTGTFVLRTPLEGVMEDSVGARTLKVTPLLLVPSVVTVTVLAETVAVAEIVKVAVTVVEFTTVIPLTVMPVPDTLITVVPVRLAPLSVTGTT
jgi:hypothetical protein